MTNDQQSTTALHLPRPLINKVLAHAQQNSDIEACGLIGKDPDNKKKYYPIDNISKSPNCQFLMDTPQQITAMRKMRDKQQQLFAIVHSHPTTDAIPSPLDVEQSSYKDVFYLIISLSTEGVLEMRAYIQQPESMQEVELVLEDAK